MIRGLDPFYNADIDDDYDMDNGAKNDNIKIVGCGRRLAKDGLMYASDDDTDNVNEDNFGVDGRKKKLVTHCYTTKRKNTVIKKRGSHGVVLCIDINYTLVDGKDRPYPSVRHFYNILRNMGDTIIVIYTHANDEYTKTLFAGEMNFFKADLFITRDTLIAYGFPGEFDKPVTLVRKLLTKTGHLSYPFVIIDDKLRNLNASQYDIVVPIVDYGKWKPGSTGQGDPTKAIDADFLTLTRNLKKSIAAFYVNKTDA